MKRCPQCEFLYEEGQRLCDMDGTELVHEPMEIPGDRPAKKRKAAISMFQLVAMVLPAVVLGGLIFFGSSGQTASNEPEATGAAPITLPGSLRTPEMPVQTTGTSSTISGQRSTDKVSPVNKPGEIPSEDNSNKASKLLRNAQPTPGGELLQPGYRVSGKSEVRKTKPMRSERDHRWERNASQKKDSKISSFLKKTGRFFKKPFQM